MNEELSTGAVLSARYRVGKLLGRGAMGAVYEATRLADGLRVAVKVLSAQTRANPSALQRFEREALAASRLGHPSIVRVIDFRAADGEAAYLVMELLEGHSLGDEIGAGGALPVPRVANITADVLSALSSAHRAGLVHRDIKPDNIVLPTGADSPVAAKLVDFGVVKMDVAGRALTQAGQVIGTPAYMSPEQWTGAPVDARSDLYALGGCMYHALMGRMAVASVTEAVAPGLSASRAREMSRERPGIPMELSALVARALSPGPAERFASADEMAQALRAALSRPARTSATHPTLPPSSYGAAPVGPSMPPPGSLSPPGSLPPNGYGASQHLVPVPPTPLAPFPSAPMPWWKGIVARNVFVAVVLIACAAWYLPSCLR